MEMGGGTRIMRSQAKNGRAQEREADPSLPPQQAKNACREPGCAQDDNSEVIGKQKPSAMEGFCRCYEE